MKLSPPETISRLLASTLPCTRLAPILACVLASCAVAMSGCGGAASPSSSSSSSSSSGGSLVIVGTQPNSLPAPPIQTDANLYTGLDVQGNIDMIYYLSNSSHSYYYQQPGASGTRNGGIFTSVGDLKELSQTDGQNSAYTLAGFSVEIEGGIAILEQGNGGFPLPDLLLAVPEQQAGCIAPNGAVAFNFIHVPVESSLNYAAATDALYGSATLNYANGAFSYSKVQQLASGGAAASTNTIPFADSYCIGAPEGYGIQSAESSASANAGSLLVYLGATGVIVGEVELPPSGTTYPLADFIGMVQPTSPIDLTTVTQGSYKGFYLQPGSGQPSNPAYFGEKSEWVTTPAFQQTSTSLIGGNEPITNLIYGPVAAIPGTILVDFGAQDSSHSGLFSSATVKEPDPNDLCPAMQQSSGPNGVTYCTFPVTALIGESYGKYAIFIAGPELTTGLPLFYALVQD